MSSGCAEASGARAATPERWLRLRAEAVIAAAARPAAELAEAVQDLGDAADALAGAGLLAPAAAGGVVQEATGALLVRGVDWLGPWVPELDDLGALGALGAPAAREPAAPALASPPRTTAVEPATYLERLAWQALALVRRRPAVEVMNAARARLGSATEALAGVGAVAAVPARVLEAFDATLAGAGLVVRPPAPAGPVPPAWAAVLGPWRPEPGVLPAEPPSGPAGPAGPWPVAPADPEPVRWRAVAAWSEADHWCLAVSGAVPSEACVWSAVDDAGRPYGGAPPEGAGSEGSPAPGPLTVRFDPALPGDWEAVAVLALDAGRGVELHLRRHQLERSGSGA